MEELGSGWVPGGGGSPAVEGQRQPAAWGGRQWRWRLGRERRGRRRPGRGGGDGEGRKEGDGNGVGQWRREEVRGREKGIGAPLGLGIFWFAEC